MSRGTSGNATVRKIILFPKRYKIITLTDSNRPENNIPRRGNKTLFITKTISITFSITSAKEIKRALKTYTEAMLEDLGAPKGLQHLIPLKPQETVSNSLPYDINIDPPQYIVKKNIDLPINFVCRFNSV
jgi:hypothetical protein